MKHCPKCGHDFPDKYRFCQYDRTTLIEVAGQQRPLAAVATTAVLPADSPQTLSGTGNEDYPQAAATTPTPRAEHNPDLTFTQEKPINKRLLMIIAGSVALVLVTGVVIYKLSGSSVESKLDEAIAKSNLLTPPGANAYELYHQLKLEGASVSTLKKFDDKLLPMLTSRPQQLLAEFNKVGSKEPSSSEWEEAAKLLTWASEMRPDDTSLAARAAYCTGRVAYLANRKDDAMEAWKRASDQDRAWALPANGVGLLYNERKDYSTARGYLLEATRRDPSWAVPYNNLGTSYFYDKDYDQAEYYYGQAVERNSQWARPHSWLGAIAMQKKDYSRAVQEFQSVLDSNAIGTENIDLGKISQQLERARQMSGQAGGQE